MTPTHTLPIWVLGRALCERQNRAHCCNCESECPGGWRVEVLHWIVVDPTGTEMNRERFKEERI